MYLNSPEVLLQTNDRKFIWFPISCFIKPFVFQDTFKPNFSRIATLDDEIPRYFQNAANMRLVLNIFNIFNNIEDENFKIDETFQDIDQPCKFTFIEPCGKHRFIYCIRY